MTGVAGPTGPWAPGTVVLWCYGQGFVEPVTVVRDEADALVVWLPAGTPVLRLVRADGRGLRADPATAFTTPTRVVAGTWDHWDVLRVAPTGQPWSAWAFFAPADGTFAGWYVNVEDPHRRDDHAVHTRDHVLDLEVEPDRSHARKDEDELAAAVEVGRYTDSEAARITAVAAEVEAVVDAWGPPFCDGWETFRPDPAWPVPTLPHGPGVPVPGDERPPLGQPVAPRF